MILVPLDGAVSLTRYHLVLTQGNCRYAGHPAVQFKCPFIFLLYCSKKKFRIKNKENTKQKKQKVKTFTK